MGWFEEGGADSDSMGEVELLEKFTSGKVRRVRYATVDGLIGNFGQG